MRVDRQTLRAMSRAALIAAVVGAGCVVASEQAAYATDAAVLDGTYRLYFDGSRSTVNGAPSSLPRATYWYAFRSACLANGCFANGTQVNTDDRTASAAFTHKVSLQFTGGRWVRWDTYETLCAEGEKSSRTTQWWLEPEADGTLTGTRTDTTSGNLCAGTVSAVITEPIIATREGDVGPGVDVTAPT